MFTPRRLSNPPDERLRDILTGARTIAVVGMSSRPERASHYVAQSLQRAGYRIVPVNPGLEQVLGEPCYPSLREVPGRMDLVLIFRRPEFVGPVVEEAIAVGAPVVWMQVGVRNPQAAQAALDAGLEVVMDRCAWVDYQRLFGRRI